MIPLPSVGTVSSVANGLARVTITAKKKHIIAPSMATVYGRASPNRFGAKTRLADAMTESARVRNSRDPSFAAYSATKV